MTDLDAAVRELATVPRLLVALDFDGVLAPIGPRPEDARPLPEAVAALRRIVADASTTLGLVSGRAATDPALRHAAPPSTTIVGSHGAEPGRIDDDGELQSLPPELDADQQQLLAQLLTAAEALVSDVEGAWVEHKPAAVVVHTRPVPDAGEATALEDTVEERLGSMAGVRPIRGKRVVELSVAHTTKGDAVALLRRGYPDGGLDERTPVLYIGDDVTDEDALGSLRPDDVGIKVGDGDTSARFRVADPDAVAGLLTRLAELLDRRPG
jgi:trehalose 6-phosphate phosphatase